MLTNPSVPYDLWVSVPIQFPVYLPLTVKTDGSFAALYVAVWLILWMSRRHFLFYSEMLIFSTSTKSSQITIYATFIALIMSPLSSMYSFHLIVLMSSQSIHKGWRIKVNCKNVRLSKVGHCRSLYSITFECLQKVYVTSFHAQRILSHNSICVRPRHAAAVLSN